MAKKKLCSIPDCGKPLVARGWCDKHYARWKNNGDPNTTSRPANGTVPNWINSHVSHSSIECLIWPFSRNNHGYGQFGCDGKNYLAHRYMCLLKNGPPPSPKHEAAHTCGNGAKGCINPQHLLWKTAIENAADKILHGATVRGVKNFNAKLTPEKVKEIRVSTERNCTLAPKYGVSRGTISTVRSRKSWGWLS